MIEAIVVATIAAIGGLGYIFRLEKNIAIADQRHTSLEVLINVHLANIDQRLSRIEKKVLNGDD